jgi:hypothetical protein
MMNNRSWRQKLTKKPRRRTIFARLGLGLYGREEDSGRSSERELWCGGTRAAERWLRRHAGSERGHVAVVHGQRAWARGGGARNSELAGAGVEQQACGSRTVARVWRRWTVVAACEIMTRWWLGQGAAVD